MALIEKKATLPMKYDGLLDSFKAESNLVDAFSEAESNVLNAVLTAKEYMTYWRVRDGVKSEHKFFGGPLTQAQVNTFLESMNGPYNDHSTKYFAEQPFKVYYAVMPSNKTFELREFPEWVCGKELDKALNTASFNIQMQKGPSAYATLNSPEKYGYLDLTPVPIAKVYTHYYCYAKEQATEYKYPLPKYGMSTEAQDYVDTLNKQYGHTHVYGLTPYLGKEAPLWGEVPIKSYQSYKMDLSGLDLSVGPDFGMTKAVKPPQPIPDPMFMGEEKEFKLFHMRAKERFIVYNFMTFAKNAAQARERILEKIRRDYGSSFLRNLDALQVNEVKYNVLTVIESKGE